MSSRGTELLGALILVAWSGAGVLLSVLMPEAVEGGLGPALASVAGVLTIVIGGILPGRPLSPLSTFAAAWLLVTGLTGGQIPEFEPISARVWYITYMVALGYGGGYFTGSLAFPTNTLRWSARSCDLLQVKGAKDRNPLPVEFAGRLMGLGICGLMLQLIIAGALPLFSRSEVGTRQLVGVPILSFIGALGSVGVYLLLESSRKRKALVILAYTYALLWLLSGERMGVFVLGLVLLARSSVRRWHRGDYLRLLGVMALALLLFYTVQWLRYPLEAIERNHIQTGLYEGTALELWLSSPLRYAGAGFRLVDVYLNTFYPGVTRGLYTIKPVLAFLQMDNQLEWLPGLSLYGMNAVPVVVPIYLDFGWSGLYLMPALFGLWSAMIYTSVRRANGRGFTGYWWTVTFIATAFSFYAYVNNYAFWVMHFPILLGVLRMLRGLGVRKGTSSVSSHIRVSV